MKVNRLHYANMLISLFRIEKEVNLSLRRRQKVTLQMLYRGSTCSICTVQHALSETTGISSYAITTYRH